MSYSADSRNGEINTESQTRYRLGGNIAVFRVNYEYNLTTDESSLNLNIMYIINFRSRGNGLKPTNEDFFVGFDLGGRISAIFGIEGDVRIGGLYKW